MLQKLTVALALALALGVLGYLVRESRQAPLALDLYGSRTTALHQLAERQSDLAQELASERLNLTSDPARMERIALKLQAAEQAAASGQNSVAGVSAGIDKALQDALKASAAYRGLALEGQKQLQDLVGRFLALREEAAHLAGAVIPIQAAAVRQDVRSLLDAVTIYSIEAAPGDGATLDTLADKAAADAPALPDPAQRTALLGFIASARALREARDTLQVKISGLAAIPASQSVETVLAAYAGHYQQQAAAAGRNQLILALYAGSLLLVFGVLGVRLRSSFLELDGINAELQHTNANLESLVDTRTQDLRKALDDLKMSESQLIQSEKLASLGQMVAGLAHEINTPLGYARSNVETVRDLLNGLRPLSRHQPDSEEVFGDCEALLGDADHGLGQIEELIMSLKNFSRMDRSLTEPFDVNEGLDTAIKICGNALKNRIQVERDYAPLPRLPAAPSQLNQVFLNILNNAAQAIDGEGSIHVHTRESGANVEISIRDSGCGMDAQTVAHIFEPFFTTKDVGKGTGLGLSIVYRIIEDHQGTIRVESAPGQGSVFIISLPKNPPRAANAAMPVAA